MVRKQQVRQTKPYQSFNSYVADEPLQEIRIDIDNFLGVQLKIMDTDIA